VAILSANSLPSDLDIAPKAKAKKDDPQGTHNPLDAARIQRAILETLLYGDLFDYPLSLAEITRYLSVPAAANTLLRLLDAGCQSGLWECAGDLYMLPGRSELVSMRMRRQAIAREKWSAALRPIHWIACLPFVRMVAVTGSLAVNNVETQDDVDLFIITAPQRLWLCRAFVILVVRFAAMNGVVICPNYFRSETQLALDHQSFFDARELTQMVPLFGPSLYTQMRSLNPWVEAYLPQASGIPGSALSWINLTLLERAGKRTMERLLSGRIGSRLEAWEMRRKVQRFNQRAQAEGGRVLFTPDCCKGHFDGHGEIIPRRFERQMARYGFVKEEVDGSS
jgi:hypothetical protein